MTVSVWFENDAPDYLIPSRIFGAVFFVTLWLYDPGKHRRNLAGTLESSVIVMGAVFLATVAFYVISEISAGVQDAEERDYYAGANSLAIGTNPGAMGPLYYILTYIVVLIGAMGAGVTHANMLYRYALAAPDSDHHNKSKTGTIYTFASNVLLCSPFADYIAAADHEHKPVTFERTPGTRELLAVARDGGKPHSQALRETTEERIYINVFLATLTVFVSYAALFGIGSELFSENVFDPDMIVLGKGCALLISVAVLLVIIFLIPIGGIGPMAHTTPGGITSEAHDVVLASGERAEMLHPVHSGDHDAEGMESVIQRSSANIRRLYLLGPFVVICLYHLLIYIGEWINWAAYGTHVQWAYMDEERVELMTDGTIRHFIISFTVSIGVMSIVIGWFLYHLTYTNPTSTRVAQ